MAPRRRIRRSLRENFKRGYSGSASNTSGSEFIAAAVAVWFWIVGEPQPDDD